MYNYIDYLPEYAKEIREFIVIGDVTKDYIDNLFFNVENVYNTSFIDGMDKKTIERWENIFGIKKRDKSIENRLIMLKSCFDSKISLSINELRDNIKSQFGYDACITVYDELYFFAIDFCGGVDYRSIVEYVQRVKPANMVCIIKNTVTINHSLYVANVLKITKDIKVSRQDLITGVKGCFYTGAVISIVKNTKIAMGSGSYGEV